MTEESWARFGAHVIPGKTRARLPTWSADCIIMSTFPFYEIDNGMGTFDDPAPNWDISGRHARIAVTWFKFQILPSSALSEPGSYPVKDLLYFVNSRWLSFDQIMALEITSHPSPTPPSRED
jgi:hypothetical protein